MALSRFIEAAPNEGSPLDVAMYWKDILDNRLEEAIGCSIVDFKTKSEFNISRLRECAGHVDKIRRKTNIAGVAAFVGHAAAAALVIGGLIALPFTFGASAGLLIAGNAVNAAAATTNVTATLVQLGWDQSDTEEANAALHDLYGVMELLYELVEICLNAFSTAHAYLQTKAGEGILKRLNALLSNDGQQNNGGKTLILKMIREFSLSESTSSTMEERSRASLDDYKKHSCKELGQNIWSSVNKLAKDKDSNLPSTMRQIALLLEDGSKDLLKVHNDFTR